ncbi:UBN2_3 domain-containing protein, partial [Cephalotus follicularis]
HILPNSFFSPLAENISTSQSTNQNISSHTTKPNPNNSTAIIISKIVNLIPIKLSRSNYLLWKSLFEPILQGHKLMHYIDSSIPPPLSTHPTYASWYEKDQMLLSWINATLSESTLPYIVGANSSK